MPKFTEPATLERPVETEASASVSSLPPEFLKFMTDVSTSVKTLAEKVDKLESSQSKFRPMSHLQRPGAVEALQIPRDKPFMEPGKGGMLPTQNGARLSDAGVMAYPQRFRVGSRVVLNLEAERGQVRVETDIQVTEKHDIHGVPYQDKKEIKREVPITWGEVVAKIPQMHCPSAPQGTFRCQGIVNPGGSCPECGWAPKIARVEFVDSRGQWVYKINFPGISSGAREQMFYDYELEHA